MCFNYFCYWHCQAFPTYQWLLCLVWKPPEYIRLLKARQTVQHLPIQTGEWFFLFIQLSRRIFLLASFKESAFSTNAQITEKSGESGAFFDNSAFWQPAEWRPLSSTEKLQTTLTYKKRAFMWIQPFSICNRSL